MKTIEVRKALLASFATAVIGWVVMAVIAVLLH